MLIFNDLRPNLIPSSCLALGMFDGVHLGHQKVILDAINKSKTMDAISTVVTFSNHPQEIILGRTPKQLTGLDQKLEIFQEMGVQAVLIIEFTKEIAKLGAEKYLKQILVETLNPKTITVGYNHHFGTKKEGDSNKLIELSKKYNFEVSIIPPICIENYAVSSSKIRSLLQEGKTYMAARLLGRPYSLINTVIKGEQRGRKMGFPTANLELPENIPAPSTGVYSGFATYNGNIYQAVINVGKRPTFGDLTKDLLEVHIINFDEDIYGKNLEVSFFKKIRGEQKFDSIDELKSQINTDCELAKSTQICIEG